VRLDDLRYPARSLEDARLLAIPSSPATKLPDNELFPVSQSSGKEGLNRRNRVRTSGNTSRRSEPAAWATRPAILKSQVIHLGNASGSGWPARPAREGVRKKFADACGRIGGGGGERRPPFRL